jgi:hypothetical protein
MSINRDFLKQTYLVEFKGSSNIDFFITEIGFLKPIIKVQKSIFLFKFPSICDKYSIISIDDDICSHRHLKKKKRVVRYEPTVAYPISHIVYRVGASGDNSIAFRICLDTNELTICGLRLVDIVAVRPRMTAKAS